MTENERITAVTETLISMGDSPAIAVREATKIVLIASTFAALMKETPERLSDEEVME